MNNLRKIAEMCNTSAAFRGTVHLNELMKTHTTFKVGGAAELFVQPADERSVLFLLCELNVHAVPLFILGGGSNVVVSDKGIAGCTLCTALLNDIGYDGTFLYCDTGCTFDTVTEFCRKNAIGGLENFAGLPGTVGGAVYMNARCYEKSISDVLAYADYLFAPQISGNCCEAAAEKRRYTLNGKDWAYKKSPFMADGPLAHTIILSAAFRVYAEDAGVVADKCAAFIQNRKDKGHFRYPSAGSVFKNNHAFGKPSGRIIDEAGLRGLRVGGAQVAPWHGNFIVNSGNASADNIKELVQKIQIEVKDKTGFALECEIIFCGK